MLFLKSSLNNMRFNLFIIVVMNIINRNKEVDYIEIYK